MMNVNKSFTYGAVFSLEIHSAHSTVTAIILDAFSSCGSAPLIGIDGHFSNSTFDITGAVCDFLWVYFKLIVSFTSILIHDRVTIAIPFTYWLAVRNFHKSRHRKWVW